MISGSWRSAADKVPTAGCGDTGPRNSETIISCTSCSDSHDRQRPGSGVIIGRDHGADRWIGGSWRQVCGGLPGTAANLTHPQSQPHSAFHGLTVVGHCGMVADPRRTG